MQFFILFVVGAVLLGAGAMLSPAWPTREPRIGLAAAFSLALVVGGAIWWAELFGWSTLVIDYLLFALVSFVVLGGTLSSAQARAEAQGETVEDTEQGWPGPEDLALFGVIALLCITPLVIMHLPTGAAAQTTGLLALTARDGGSFTQLAPYYELEVITAPGYQALTAYLSQQLGQSTPLVQWSVAAVIAFLCAWVAYDLGSEIRNKMLGRCLALSTIASLGVASLFINGFYPQLLGILFGMAALAYTLRVHNHGYRLDCIAAGLMYGALLYVSPTLFAVLVLSTLLWVVLASWRRTEPEKTVRLPGLRWALVGAAWLFGVGPWLLSHIGWLAQSPGEVAMPSLSNLTLLLTHYGIWTVPAALLGAFFGWRTVEPMARQAIIWCGLVLLLSVDLGAIGVLPALIPPLFNQIMPEQLIWLGALLPMTILASFALLWVYQQLPAIRSQLVYGTLLSAATVIVLSWVVVPQFFSNRLDTAITASVADVAAMRWLADNGPPDAVILNHPQAGLWAAALTEREVVYLPQLPTMDAIAPAADLTSFWQEAQPGILSAAGITYVLVPEHVIPPWADLPDYLTPAAPDAPGVYRVQPPNP